MSGTLRSNVCVFEFRQFWYQCLDMAWHLGVKDDYITILESYLAFFVASQGFNAYREMKRNAYGGSAIFLLFWQLQVPKMG